MHGNAYAGTSYFSPSAFDGAEVSVPWGIGCSGGAL